MVRTYNDPAKEKSRERLRAYLETYLRPHKKPQDIKVVCFPGAEVEGEEALEVLQVYDLLGIPRKNIVGLEYNPSAAERLQHANLGLEVICQDSLDFFKTTNKKFDVISLDYTGHRTWKERDTTRYIAGRQILTNNGVFCTNHAIKRESKEMQQSLLNGIVGGDIIYRIYESIDPLIIGTPEFQQEFNRLAEDFEEERERLERELKQGKIPLDIVRNAITQGNIAIFGRGNIELDPTRQMFAKNNSLKEFAIRLDHHYEKPKNSGLESDIPLYQGYNDACQYAVNNVIANLISEGFDKEIALGLIQTISCSHHGARPPKNLERYTYTSNKNYKMLMDIFQVRETPRSWVRAAEYLLNPTLNDGMLHPVNPQFLSRKDRKIFEKFTSEFNPEFFKIRIDDPVDLGSSYRPPEKISKDEAIVLLQDGLSPAEIAGCYEGFKGQRKDEKSFKTQLAALKAHLTMGTYNKKS